MKMRVDLTQADVVASITAYLEDKLGLAADDSVLTIECKSKQNYRSEWEAADFRAFILRS